MSSAFHILCSSVVIERFFAVESLGGLATRLLGISAALIEVFTLAASVASMFEGIGTSEVVRPRLGITCQRYTPINIWSLNNKKFYKWS